MPVVNMGLHGGLGNAFHEKMAKYNVQEGDIYIICHSDYNDNGTILEPPVAWIAIEDHFELWRLVDRKDFIPMLRYFPVYLKKAIVNDYDRTMASDIHERDMFNEYGDIGTLRIGSNYKFDGCVEPPQISDEVVRRINRLNKYLTDRGATLLIAGYPIGNGDNTASPEQFEQFEIQLRDRMDCPVISHFVDYMYDYDYFYDTELHLNSEGAKLRTKQLIEDLKKWQMMEN